MKHYAELSLIFGLPIFLKSKKLHNGRFKNLCARLQKETKKDLNKIMFPKVQISKMTDKLEEFMKAAGWYKSEKHIMTYLSFCLAMIENSEFEYNFKIIDTLNDIVEYLERGGYMPAPCMWAGDVAAKKWEKIFK